MASTSRLHSLPRKKKPSSALGRWAHAVFGRMFCKRTIIILSNHKTQHVPFSGGVQLFALVGALAIVAWSSYSSGSYMAAQQIIQEKERKLATTTSENERVGAEFALLKSDLMKLAEASKSGKAGEYTKMIADQYAASNTGSAPASGAAPVDATAENYNAVFKRIEYLDNKVRELQTDHDLMMADIRSTTGGKIKELEQVIARTGMDTQPLQRAADAKRLQEEQRREKYGRTEGAAGALGNGQGGPYVPLPTSVLKTKETSLYFDLRRLMALNDIVGAMPLDIPFANNNFRQTSSFGGRSDPFHGSAAFHSGLDLAAVDGSKILATNNGRVEFAGWKTAYGYVVDIKHDYGFSTRYAHLSRVMVQPDQIVKKGQAIGVQGSTGRSTGHHLHYEVRYNGRPINPANFLKAGADVRSFN